ncbi:MAG: TetR family transcriptional regulator [Stagnimonas sp.]|nr:TetR family transcriptional regulator [Stagnimonas sp.]
MSLVKPRKSTRSTLAERELPEAGGRERLIAAALKLAAEKRSLLALGVRELGRMAGLNPNTFYRHFKSLDELSVAIIDEFAQDLAPALRAIRLSGVPVELVSARTVEYVFDYARQHPEAFIVGVRELHGSSGRLQQAIRARIKLVAAEMSEDILATNGVPGITADMLDELAEPIVEQVFHRTLDYLEEPRRRAELVRRTAHFIDALMTGAVAMKAMNRWD